MFEGRSHLLPAQRGWEEIADYALSWAERHAASLAESAQRCADSAGRWRRGLRRRPPRCGKTADGTGFNTNNAQIGPTHCDLDCSGVRGQDWNMHADHLPDTALGFVCNSCLGGSGPCGKEVHCAGYPAGQAAWVEDFCRAVYHAEFVQGRRIDQPETIHVILSELKVDAEKTLAAAQSGEIKDKLRAQTAEQTMGGVCEPPRRRPHDRLCGKRISGESVCRTVQSFVLGGDLFRQRVHSERRKLALGESSQRIAYPRRQLNFDCGQLQFAERRHPDRQCDAVLLS